MVVQVEITPPFLLDSLIHLRSCEASSRAAGDGSPWELGQEDERGTCGGGSEAVGRSHSRVYFELKVPRGGSSWRMVPFEIGRAHV